MGTGIIRIIRDLFRQKANWLALQKSNVIVAGESGKLLDCADV